MTEAASHTSLIVSFLEESAIRRGQPYNEELPAHLTIMPPFSLEAQFRGALTNRLINLSTDVPPLKVEGAEAAKPTAETGVPARMLRKESTICRLHLWILKDLVELDADIEEPNIGERFHPYVTATGASELKPGEPRRLTSMHVVDILQGAPLQYEISQQYVFTGSPERLQRRMMRGHVRR